MEKMESLDVIYEGGNVSATHCHGVAYIEFLMGGLPYRMTINGIRELISKEMQHNQAVDAGASIKNKAYFCHFKGKLCGHLDYCNKHHKCFWEESKDPWKHRSYGMRCRTCMFFALKAKSEIAMGFIPDERGNIGRCRRHAPTMNGYPVCYEDDWCGDHKVDENKVQP